MKNFTKERLLKIIEEKNLMVQKQLYEASARLRDQEKVHISVRNFLKDKESDTSHFAISEDNYVYFFSFENFESEEILIEILKEVIQMS